MTDRELLELAAKAAGVVGWFANNAPDAPIFFDDPNNRSMYGSWNPLTDDGDALRLAVKLDMEVNLNRVDEMTVVCYGYFAGEKIKEEHDGDPYAATRRAIVRAAAEIGKAMP